MYKTPLLVQFCSGDLLADITLTKTGQSLFLCYLCSVIKSTQKASGLSKVSEKLFSGKLNDSIHYVNNTAIQMRELTLEAFNIAVEANLMSLSTENATVSPLTTAIRKYVPKGDCKIMLSAAEKLGAWCSELTLLEVGKWLKVRF